MTAEEKEHMYELCGKILIEDDQGEMVRLVRELNDLLALKEKRLQGMQPAKLKNPRVQLHHYPSLKIELPLGVLSLNC